MTPWAELLVRPRDGDDRVREAFHRIAETQHPDANGGAVGPRWHAARDAYAALRTDALRARAARAVELRAGNCPSCKGYGVQGLRPRLCPTCRGEGSAPGVGRKG